MNLTLPGLGDKALVGNAAGWHLSFHKAKKDGDALVPDEKDDPVLELGNDRYHAEIQAALPCGLEGGVYSFVIEGLTDDDYKKVARKKGAPEFVKLFLYWVDANASVKGYLANLGGLTDALGGVKAKDIPEALVAVLQVVSVSRKAGARRYETTVTAREWVFERLSASWLGEKGIQKDKLADVLDELLQKTARLRKNKDYKFHGADPNPACPPQPVPGSPPKVELAGRRAVVEVLNQCEKLLAEETGCFGRGLFLIRDGCLHVGTRPIPFDGADKPPKRLTLGTGLVEVEALAPVPTDPGFDRSKKPGESPPSRRQFRLTLKGRPDLKPGDMVEFDSPPEDAEQKTGGGLLGAVGDLLAGPVLAALGGDDFKNPVKLYVAAVEHRLGRTRGFATTVTGVEVKDPKAKWDCHTPSPHGADLPPAASACVEMEAAQAVRSVARAVLGARQPAQVGEVRKAYTKGNAEPPGQTLGIWRGLKPGDPRAYRARRTPVQRPSPAPAGAVPYATPFAWGKCGLVLPRYPGTRVLVVHADGSSDDPIDVGALWESGKGPESQPGDWWLILPVNVPQDRRESLPDDQVAQEHAGRVTQDLIDAEGNRVIEVGELTVRIGRDDKLKNAGERPARGLADAVTVEHAGGGAKLVIDKDGKVTITAKNIELDAGAAGTITMKAKDVDVHVRGSMNVH
jgi:hypothetical protein